MDWKLTDEEMRKAYEKEALKYPYSLGAPLYHGKRAIAKAAQKKLVEWLKSKCTNTRLLSDLPMEYTFKINSVEMQELLKSLGLEE